MGLSTPIYVKVKWLHGPPPPPRIFRKNFAAEFLRAKFSSKPHSMTFISAGKFTRARFGNTPSSPRKKLSILAGIISIVVLAMPMVTSGNMVQMTFGSQEDNLLAIDSPTFSLDQIAMTEDGFILKTSSQTATVDRSQFSDVITYKVDAGDSLSSIASRFGVSINTILWENDIANRHNLKVGSILRILPVTGVSHVVAGKETIETIAKKYSVSPEKIAKQNKISDGKLVAGAKIIIPDGKRIIATEEKRYIATSTGRGTYAAYKTAPIDGTVILNNAERGKDGRWMIKPVDGLYTTNFKPGHWGIDIANRAAPGIHAAANGTVVKSQCGWNGGYGCMIVVDHGDGYQTLYGHMSKLYVGVGDKVNKSTTIGKMGNTGNVHGATGIHLHFEVVRNGRKVNPIAYYH